MATPPYDARWNAGDGDWSDPLDWLEYDPVTNQPETYVPGTDDSVSLPSNGTPYTVTYGSQDEVWSLDSVGGATLDLTGGSLTLDNASSLGGAVDVAAGASLIAASGAGSIGISSITSDGTLTANSGDTLDVAFGVETLGGTIGGAGELDLDAGSAVTVTTPTITAGSIVINDGYEGGSVTFDVDLTYAGAFTFQNGTLDLNGYTLTLSGAAVALSGGGVFGPGTLKITGETTVDGVSVGFDGAAATLEDAGSITQSYTFNLGGTALIDAGATYTFNNATYISGGTTTNNGTLVDDSGGGNVNIYGTFTNNGTVTVDSGDTFDVEFVTATLGGTIGGAGELDLDAGSAVRITTPTITAGSIVINDGYEGGSVTFDVDLTYAGAFTFQNGTLDLNGYTLTLSGSDEVLAGGTIFGPGTLKITGETTIDGVTVGLNGTPATIEDAGSMAQNYGLNLSGKLLIDAGATYAFTAATSINDYGATIINDGTFTDAATGSSSLGGAFTNNGQLLVAAGSLTIDDATTNNGALDAAAGSLVLYGALAVSDGGVGFVEVGPGQSVDFKSAVASNQQVVFQGASATAILEDPQQFDATIAGFSAGDTISLTGIAYRASYEIVWNPGSGAAQIVDTASRNTVVATLDFTGDLSGGLLTLSAAGGGTDVALAPDSFVDAGPGDIVVSSVSGQSYSAFEQVYSAGVYEGTDEFFTGVMNQPYSAYAYDFSAGGDFIGSSFIYPSPGANYASKEVDYDSSGNVTRVAFTDDSVDPFSSYEYGYVGGVFSGSKFTYTSVPAGASYSSYQVDYDQNNNFIGDKFFFADLPGQSYTGEEVDFDASGNLSRVLLTGVTDQAYSSLELDYSAGTYAGYKAYYDITGQSFTSEEVDVSAANAITKVVYSGLTGTPYSSVEEAYSGGAPTDAIYDFTDVSGASAYAYQVTENANGNPLQETFDNNDGSHTIIGLANNQRLTSLGDDTMTGGGSGATFVFNPVYGHDTITDFSTYDAGAGRDTISLPSSEFANFAAALGAATNSGGGVLITATDGDTLTLKNLNTTTLAGLGADFNFHS